MVLADIFDKGGVVVWVLLGYSILALAIIIERLAQFLLMGRFPAEFEQRLPETLARGELGSVVNGIKGPEATILAGTLAAAAAGIHDLTRVAQRIGSTELQRMERGFRTLGILGNTAPLLGLLGTILGMIKAFMVIEQAGGKVDAQALAGGIWEAMLTTGVGLVVAIPILLALHMLEGMADRRAQNMRSCASLLLEHLPHSEAGEEAEATHHRESSVHAV